MNNSTTFTQWVDASPFRKNIAVLVLVFVALALITKTVLLYKQVSHFGENANYLPSVSATGKAEEYIKPDTLTFSITVNDEDKDVVSASKKVDTKISKAMEILKANGVLEKNIKTTSRNVNDTYGSKSEPCVTADVSVSNSMKMMAPTSPVIVPYPCVNTTQKVTGVSIYQTLDIKIPDIDKDVDGAKRSKLISELEAANIKTGDISFTVYDLDAVKLRVRAEAIKKAKEDAKTLAKNLGVRLGQLQSFSDNGGGYNPYLSAREVMSDSLVKSAPQAVLPAGEQKVTSEVTVSYLIK